MLAQIHAIANIFQLQLTQRICSLHKEYSKRAHAMHVLTNVTTTFSNSQDTLIALKTYYKSTYNLNDFQATL